MTPSANHAQKPSEENKDPDTPSYKHPRFHLWKPIAILPHFEEQLSSHESISPTSVGNMIVSEFGWPSLDVHRENNPTRDNMVSHQIRDG